MEADRTEQAIQRIEAALARIAEAAETLPAPAENGAQGETGANGTAGMPPSVSQLVVRHEALREEVSNQIKRIDDLVGKLEQ